MAGALFGVAADGGDQLVGALLACTRIELWGGDMLAQVGIEDFVQKSVHGAAHGGDLLENVGAVGGVGKGALNGSELARDAPHPGGQCGGVLKVIYSIPLYSICLIVGTPPAYLVRLFGV